jgi:Flp pilus assembly CpaF family ATPase
MKIWYNNILDSRRYAAEIVGKRVSIGRATDNDIVLNSPFVAERAAVLQQTDSRWELVSLGRNGCKLEGKSLCPGERGWIEQSRLFQVFPFQFMLDNIPAECSEPLVLYRERDLAMLQLIRKMHAELLALMDLGDAEGPRNENEEYLLILERNIEEIARQQNLLAIENVDLLRHVAGHCVRSGIVERILEQDTPLADLAGHLTPLWSRLISAVPERENELELLVQRLATQLEVDAGDDISRRINAVEAGFWRAWGELSLEIFEELCLYLAMRELKKQLKDIIFGYGPLEDLLRTPTISEIMVVNRDHIYVEKNNVVENSGRQFISDDITHTVIERIVSKVGRRIDKSQPLVDARLSDGSRVNAVIGPIALSGPTLTIRKFPQRRMQMEDLVRRESITPSVAEFLRAAVLLRRNIIIAGGTGTGKTTLLNCLANYIPEKERIVTIEDTAELQIDREHVVRMESKQANIEGSGAYSIHDLVRNALRMRPDRIIVGECRGPESLDMLQAMNTGHDGSLTTIHANSAADVILRLEVMVQAAAPLPLESIHRQIASAIHLVVQLSRTPQGRKVTQVSEIIGLEDEGLGIRLKDIFLLENPALPGVLQPTGRLPTFMDRLIDQNLIALESFYR